MAFLSLKMVGPPPSFSGTNNEGSRIKRSTDLRKVVRTHLQVRSEKVIEQQAQCPKSLSVSRRDTMLSAVSLAAITLFSTDSAEARMWNPEIKRKIFEKLQLLREKTGLSKPKSEDKKAAEEKQKTPAAEEKHKSASAEGKHKSSSPQPPTTLPKGKSSEPPKQETPPLPVPQNSSGNGH